MFLIFLPHKYYVKINDIFLKTYAADQANVCIFLITLFHPLFIITGIYLCVGKAFSPASGHFYSDRDVFGSRSQMFWVQHLA